MDQRERNSLDRYITGDYGERQLRGIYASGKEACAKALEMKDRLCERCSGAIGKMSYAAWIDLGGVCDRCVES